MKFVKKFCYIISGAVILSMSSCVSGIDKNMLIGKWNYVRVGVPDSSPPDTVTHAELEDNKPFIEFKPDNSYEIIWGGKQLSHGIYTISGKNIKVTEDLGNGKKRDFQFYISRLTAKSITFETVGQGGSRVTAVKD